MLDFSFVSPTRYVFGRGAESQIGSELKNSGAKKILLVYYNDPVFLKTGLVERIKASLTEAGLKMLEMNDVIPNARLEGVYKGIKIAKEAGDIDVIVGIGGGSVLDTAKGIAMGYYYEGDVWDFYTGKGTPKKALPVAAVVTLAAAGSEASRVSVISNEDLQLKKACPSDLIRPAFAFINPELGFTVPKFPLACGAYDIVSHVFERYFSPSTDVDLTDRLCEAVMVAAINAGLKAVNDPTDYEAQATLFWAAPMAQNDFLSTGRAKDGVCHNLEHEIGAIYDVAHGAGLSALFTAWAKYVYKSNVPRFVQYAERVWGVQEGDPEKAALAGIDCTTEYFRKMGLPTNLKELGVADKITEEIMHTMAVKGLNGAKTMGGIKALDENDIVEIFKLAME